MEPNLPKRYSHAMDLGFEVDSDSADDPTPEEILQGLERRVENLRQNREELREACGIFDTIDRREDDKDDGRDT
jgi:hypothetical protein